MDGAQGARRNLVTFRRRKGGEDDASGEHFVDDVKINAFVADVTEANKESFRSERTAVAEIEELDTPTEATTIAEYEMVDGVAHLYSAYTSDGTTAESIVIGEQGWILEGDSWVEPDGVADVPRPTPDIEQLSEQIEGVEY